MLFISANMQVFKFSRFHLSLVNFFCLYEMRFMFFHTMLHHLYLLSYCLFVNVTFLDCGNVIVISLKVLNDFNAHKIFIIFLSVIYIFVNVNIDVSWKSNHNFCELMNKSKSGSNGNSKDKAFLFFFFD